MDHICRWCGALIEENTRPMTITKTLVSVPGSDLPTCKWGPALDEDGQPYLPYLDAAGNGRCGHGPAHFAS